MLLHVVLSVLFSPKSRLTGKNTGTVTPSHEAHRVQGRDVEWFNREKESLELNRNEEPSANSNSLFASSWRDRIVWVSSPFVCKAGMLHEIHRILGNIEQVLPI
jgi:hypothetical protein